MFSDVLLAVDFDRTLTATDSSIPQRNIEAIRYFMENGGAFTINTGRSVPMTNWFRDQVPFNAPLLLYNGSAAWDAQKGQFTQAYELELDPQTFILDLQERFPELNVEQQGTYAHHLFHKNPAWEAYCENNLCPWEYADPANVPRPFLKLALCGEFRANTVASMYEATEAELELFDRAVAYIERTYGDKVDVFRACPRIADIHAKGCSKLASARELQRQLGKKILVCVGDGDNDLTMMEGADYAWCPSDAMIADRFENVCPCGEGAVADVIYKKIPKILGLQP
jgi:HAD superfamily hydrolase (TIGR01484 family)